MIFYANDPENEHSDEIDFLKAISIDKRSYQFI